MKLLNCVLLQYMYWYVLSLCSSSLVDVLRVDTNPLSFMYLEKLPNNEKINNTINISNLQSDAILILIYMYMYMHFRMSLIYIYINLSLSPSLSLPLSLSLPPPSPLSFTISPYPTPESFSTVHTTSSSTE